ncbi:hypothetical protein [Jeotgalibacillus soli]|uniref:Uncharacterized protein n=1 Tax=Jeotgalibacillus soli TaxID=889306 RepID=A0A0C2RS68_9BACL|nr:hypothetical protein [Jeotgalibacillus soli]KIL44589.1 hypothetical protein KP78_35530 [Jeotgalibacillus soli]
MEKRRVKILIVLFFSVFILSDYLDTIQGAHPFQSTDTFSKYDNGLEPALNKDGEHILKFFTAVPAEATILILLVLFYYQFPIWYLSRKMIFLQPIYFGSKFLNKPI